MVIHGVDTARLPDQFGEVVPGRTLIYDGDATCYVAAASAKRLDTAVRRFQQSVLQAMFMAGASDCRVHLTSRDCAKHGRYRVKAGKPYQGNRSGKAKPALLEPLREAVFDRSNWLDDYTVQLHRDIEADDAMIQDAYRLQGLGVIRSEDKDLRMTPYLYYDLGTGTVRAGQEHGFVSIRHTGGGTPKLAGQGPMFFWGQMLMGDQADNIQGLQKLNGKLCGPAAAYGALKDCQTVHEAANIVIDGYRAIGQNVVAEGWLLWLTRWPKDNVIQYMESLVLTDQNREYVRECCTRDWVHQEIQNDEGYED